MRYIILSDIQANLEALSSCLEDIVQYSFPSRGLKEKIMHSLESVGRTGSWKNLRRAPVGEEDSILICLGDTIAYGANPNVCLELMRGLARWSLPGNHEFCVLSPFIREKVLEQYAESQRKESFHRMWEWTAEKLTEQNRQYLQAWCSGPVALFSRTQQGWVRFSHALPVFPRQFQNFSHIESVELYFRYEKFQGNISFMGHGHFPGFIYGVKDNGKGSKELAWYDCRHYPGEEIMTFPTNGYNRLLISVPSVGQPRDGSPLTGYCLYDSAQQKVHFCRMVYDVEGAVRKIIGAGLPEWFGERLRTGE